MERLEDVSKELYVKSKSFVENILQSNGINTSKLDINIHYKRFWITNKKNKKRVYLFFKDGKDEKQTKSENITQLTFINKKGYQ